MRALDLIVTFHCRDKLCELHTRGDGILARNGGRRRRGLVHDVPGASHDPMHHHILVIGGLCLAYCQPQVSLTTLHDAMVDAILPPPISIRLSSLPDQVGIHARVHRGLSTRARTRFCQLQKNGAPGKSCDAVRVHDTVGILFGMCSVSSLETVSSYVTLVRLFATVP